VRRPKRSQTKCEGYRYTYPSPCRHLYAYLPLSSRRAVRREQDKLRKASGSFSAKLLLSTSRNGAGGWMGGGGKESCSSKMSRAPRRRQEVDQLVLDAKKTTPSRRSERFVGKIYYLIFFGKVEGREWLRSGPRERTRYACHRPRCAPILPRPSLYSVRERLPPTKKSWLSTCRHPTCLLLQCIHEHKIARNFSVIMTEACHRQPKNLHAHCW